MSEYKSRISEKVVAGVLAFTCGTHLEADVYEQRLLTRYGAGELTLDQVEYLLKKREELIKELRLFC